MKEIDVLIIKNVTHKNTAKQFSDAYVEGVMEDFTPSTNIADAWRVVEKLKDMKFTLERYEEFMMDYEKAESCTKLKFRASFNGISIEEDYAPLAICKAALWAAGVEVE